MTPLADLPVHADEVLDDLERRALERAGYGGRSGFGRNPAVLVIDVTYGFCGDPDATDLVEAVGTYPHASGPAAWDAVPHVAAIVDAARSSAVPIVFTHPRRPLTATSGRWSDKNRRQHDVPARAYDIIEELHVAPDDRVLAKEAPSAFAGTPLLRWLVGAGIDGVIVCGGTTSGCVRATAVDAFSYDLRVVVAGDATFDRVQASHRVGLFDLDLKYADVVSSEQVVGHLLASAKDAS